MRYSNLDEFIADIPRLAERAAGKLAGHSGMFCLVTKQGRTLCCRMEDGRVTLMDTAEGPFDCTVTADEQDLLGMVNGTVNPATAILFGKVRVQGSPVKLLSLISLL